MSNQLASDEMIIRIEYLSQFIEDNYPPAGHELGELTMVDFMKVYPHELTIAIRDIPRWMAVAKRSLNHAKD
ncbi:hypothetical protein [Sulfurimonas sp.]|uniref:hypothetical protein n=1 Tax=Sulfurimonas sp. TaxID=2022749 RepID=UPI0039E67CAB